MFISLILKQTGTAASYLSKCNFEIFRDQHNYMVLYHSPSNLVLLPKNTRIPIETVIETNKNILKNQS